MTSIQWASSKWHLCSIMEGARLMRLRRILLRWCLHVVVSELGVTGRGGVWGELSRGITWSDVCFNRLTLIAVLGLGSKGAGKVAKIKSVGGLEDEGLAASGEKPVDSGGRVIVWKKGSQGCLGGFWSEQLEGLSFPATGMGKTLWKNRFWGGSVSGYQCWCVY